MKTIVLTMNREVQHVKEQTREKNHGLGGKGVAARKQQRLIKVEEGGKRRMVTGTGSWSKRSCG